MENFAKVYGIYINLDDFCFKVDGCIGTAKGNL